MPEGDPRFGEIITHGDKTVGVIDYRQGPR